MHGKPEVLPPPKKKKKMKYRYLTRICSGTEFFCSTSFFFLIIRFCRTYMHTYVICIQTSMHTYMAACMRTHLYTYTIMRLDKTKIWPSVTYLYVPLIISPSVRMCPQNLFQVLLYMFPGGVSACPCLCVSLSLCVPVSLCPSDPKPNCNSKP